MNYISEAVLVVIVLVLVVRMYYRYSGTAPQSRKNIFGVPHDKSQPPGPVPDQDYDLQRRDGIWL